MFARLTIYENVDLDLADRVKQFMETSQTDPFGELPGYRGSMTLVDRDNARLVGIGFYASAGHAKEADVLLTTTWYEAVADQVPDPIRPALDMRPDSVGLYELVHRDRGPSCASGATSPRHAHAAAVACRPPRRSARPSSRSHVACGASASRLAQRRSDVSIDDRVAAASARPVRVRSHHRTKEEHHEKGQGSAHHAGRQIRPDFLRSILGHCAKSQQPMSVKTAFAVLLMASLLGIAACGDDDADEGGTTASPDVETTSTTAAESNEPILIKTHLAPVKAQGKTSGEVLSGSTIGDSAFCARGRFIDGPVEVPSRSVLRSFRCPGGTLTITFTSTPPGVRQRSDWKVVNGLGRFEGLSGGGRMRGVLESGRGGGRETFTGTVTR